MPKLKGDVPLGLPPGSIPVETRLGLRGEQIIVSQNDGRPMAVLPNNPGTSGQLKKPVKNPVAVQKPGESTAGPSTSRTVHKSGIPSAKEVVQEKIKKHQVAVQQQFGSSKKTVAPSAKQGRQLVEVNKRAPSTGQNTNRAKACSEESSQSAVSVWMKNLTADNVADILTACSPPVESLNRIVLVLKAQLEDMDSEKEKEQKSKIAGKLKTAILCFKQELRNIEDKLREAGTDKQVTVIVESDEEEEEEKESSTEKMDKKDKVSASRKNSKKSQLKSARDEDTNGEKLEKEKKETHGATVEHKKNDKITEKTDVNKKEEKLKEGSSSNEDNESFQESLTKILAKISEKDSGSSRASSLDSSSRQSEEPATEKSKSKEKKKETKKSEKTSSSERSKLALKRSPKSQAEVSSVVLSSDDDDDAVQVKDNIKEEDCESQQSEAETKGKKPEGKKKKYKAENSASKQSSKITAEKVTSSKAVFEEPPRSPSLEGEEEKMETSGSEADDKNQTKETEKKEKTKKVKTENKEETKTKEESEDEKAQTSKQAKAKEEKKRKRSESSKESSKASDSEEDKEEGKKNVIEKKKGDESDEASDESSVSKAKSESAGIDSEEIKAEIEKKAVKSDTTDIETPLEQSPVPSAKESKSSEESEDDDKPLSARIQSADKVRESRNKKPIVDNSSDSESAKRTKKKKQKARKKNKSDDSSDDEDFIPKKAKQKVQNKKSRDVKKSAYSNSDSEDEKAQSKKLKQKQAKSEQKKSKSDTSDDESGGERSSKHKKKSQLKSKEAIDSSDSDSDDEALSKKSKQKKELGPAKKKLKTQSDEDSDDSKPLLKMPKHRHSSKNKKGKEPPSRTMKKKLPKDDSDSDSSKGKKKKEPPSKAMKKKPRKDDSDSDSEFEKEFKKLAKAPRLKPTSEKSSKDKKLKLKPVVILKELKERQLKKFKLKVPLMDGAHDSESSELGADPDDNIESEVRSMAKSNSESGDNHLEELLLNGAASSSDEKPSEDGENAPEEKTKVKPKGKAKQKKTLQQQIDELSSDDSDAEMKEESKAGQSESGDDKPGADFSNLMDNLLGEEQVDDSRDRVNIEDENALNAILNNTQDSTDSDSDSDLVDPNKKKNKEKTEKKAAKVTISSSDGDESETSKTEKRKRINDRLLNTPLSSSSDEDIIKKPAKKEKKKKDSDSSSSEEEVQKKKGKKRKKASTPSSSGSDSDFYKSSKKKKKSRIKKKAGSSDSEAQAEEDSPSKQHKKIRRIIKDTNLSQEAHDALKAEEERRKRIAERQKKYNYIETKDVDDESQKESKKKITRLVLETDEDDKEKAVLEVDKKLLAHLKPHQVEAVQFLWDNCCESVKQIKDEEGSGCILAHSMGLGKTLTVIAFVHTLMSNFELTGTRTVLVICPLNTVLNWQNEFSKWIEDKEQFSLWELTSVKDNYTRTDLLKDWQDQGGILLMGYDMYRNLTTHKNIKKQKIKKTITETLVSPGPDVVVCDEGHLLKNSASSLSIAVNNIKTRRRVVLTGTPLQNNLIEYHCMVDFVKPKLLGTKKEFSNRFVNPITNGQAKDATQFDVNLMKKRAHILHETLAGCVQRRDYSILKEALGPKHEYVIMIRLSDLQMQLYEKYLQTVGRNEEDTEKVRGATLFSDYQNLMRIWNHPYLLQLGHTRDQNKYKEDEMDDFLDDSESDMSSFIASDSEEDGKSSSSGSDDSSKKKKKKDSKEKDSRKDLGKTRRSKRLNQDAEEENSETEEEEDKVKTDGLWWQSYISEKSHFDLHLGGKIFLLAEILRMCEAIGDKVLLFSQSLLSLDCIEDYLNHWDSDGGDNPDKPIAGTLGWTREQDYFRMDGSTSPQNRKAWADIFNDPDNHQARLFLISTRAGSLGTNLVGGNRVIIFDASWNPSHDMQSMFRVYRFGQTKPVYVYRFLAQGTMEQKIYERQVTKESLSHRVVDEHQIERHFTKNDLRELYAFNPDRWDPESPQDTPTMPKDLLLADLLHDYPRWIVRYHEHDSLLEEQEGEGLTEEERRVAWQEYEDEKKHGFRRQAPRPQQQGVSYQQQMQWIQQQALYRKCQEAEPDTCTPQFLNTMREQIRQMNEGLTPEQVEAYLDVYRRQYTSERYQRIKERYTAALQQMYRQQLAEQQRQQQQMLQQQVAALVPNIDGGGQAAAAGPSTSSDSAQSRLMSLLKK